MPDSSLFGFCGFWASDVFVELPAFVPVFDPRQRSLLVMPFARLLRVVFAIRVVAYLLGGAPSVHAQTTLNSGTTTVSTGTNFGNDLFVATTGTATLEVIAGGYATNTDCYLAYDAGGVGTATVSSGTWANRGLLFVGTSGTGTLNVNGGYVSNTGGFLGYYSNSVGTATVSDGTWANSVNLTVGHGGTGTLNVTGGSVTSTDGWLGYDAGSVGTATVSGTWANSGDLFVGYMGTGTLNVTGGSVTSANGALGGYYFDENAGVGFSGVGTATVSSGTWANSGDLDVGFGGTGTLTMTGGLVRVGGTLSTGTFGTINLNSGGTLQIGTGSTSGVLGVSTLTNNGTLVFNRSDASIYSGVLSGSGAVTKQAAGLLTLAGANSYSGLTTIAAGTLALSGTGSIGTGGLNLGTTGSPGVFDLLGLTASSYSLPSSASLAGVGTISGSGKSLAVLGSLAPGNSAGTITVGTGLSLDLSNSGTSVFEITNPAFTAGTFDLVSGDGSVVFGGILNLAFSGGSYADGTDVLQIFANTGGRSGNFSAVNATGLAAGQSATFNSATGFITVVPEPSTYAMAIAGLAYGGSVMFRRRRAR
jgi:T5SS/PEP-CTERM-associated repeat protein